MDFEIRLYRKNLEKSENVKIEKYWSRQIGFEDQENKKID